MNVEEALRAAARSGRVLRDAPLADLTTFKVGGAADWLVEVTEADALPGILAVARNLDLPLTVLGGGSNVLIGDRGIRGVVVRLRGGSITLVDRHHLRADAGVTINGLVRWTVNRGIAGLEAWAGTPGTVGGAVHGNAHFDGRLIGQLIDSVQLVTRGGALEDVPGAAMEFSYDDSRLRHTGEILVAATFRVGSGDPAALRGVARQSLAYRKRTQPLQSPSAGCIFQNPDPGTEPLPPGVPASAGALIDRAGLKGHGVGGARVSLTHGNFIVNEGGATAADIRTLIALCRESVAATFGVNLREEIVYLGEY